MGIAVLECRYAVQCDVLGEEGGAAIRGVTRPMCMATFKSNHWLGSVLYAQKGLDVAELVLCGVAPL